MFGVVLETSMPYHILLSLIFFNLWLFAISFCSLQYTHLFEAQIIDEKLFRSGSTDST